MTLSEQGRPEPAPTPSTAPAVPARTDRQMRRIATASFTGTVIEFYDLTLYAVTASLVFAKVSSRRSVPRRGRSRPSARSGSRSWPDPSAR
jgi:hypothetical protein